MRNSHIKSNEHKFYWFRVWPFDSLPATFQYSIWESLVARTNYETRELDHPGPLGIWTNSMVFTQSSRLFWELSVRICKLHAAPPHSPHTSQTWESQPRTLSSQTRVSQHYYPPPIPQTSHTGMQTLRIPDWRTPCGVRPTIYSWKVSILTYSPHSQSGLPSPGLDDLPFCRR